MLETKFVKGYFHNLLTWDELSNLINIRPLMSSKRVQILNLDKRVEWDNTIWNADTNCIPPSIIRSLLDELVIYFVDMSRATKNINDFSKNIEDEYGRQVDAHIYVCRNLEIEHPFGAHYDFSDNVIVQCEGVTNFKVWEEVKNVSKDEINTKMKIDSEPILDVNMEEGDTIWIPKHYPHQATSLTPRLSVSFPLSSNVNISDTREDRNWITL
tara:strand:+ start:1067 stop:1705 length:639 start_codon:yes stop_codon:yes gene_type:complete